MLQGFFWGPSSPESSCWYFPTHGNSSRALTHLAVYNSKSLATAVRSQKVTRPTCTRRVLKLSQRGQPAAGPRCGRLAHCGTGKREPDRPDLCSHSQSHCPAAHLRSTNLTAVDSEKLSVRSLPERRVGQGLNTLTGLSINTLPHADNFATYIQVQHYP